MVIQNHLSDLDKLIDLGGGNKELVSERAKLLQELFDLNSKTSLDLFQKAKIRWVIEGDENSKYFHGIINKKDQLEDLEKNISYEEIKKRYVNVVPINLRVLMDLPSNFSWWLLSQMSSPQLNGANGSKVAYLLLWVPFLLMEARQQNLNFAKDKQNVATIVNVLKCFFLASGLKINLHKSKLMGIGIPKTKVRSTAESIGCSTFVSPFNFLGVKVGGLMSRRSSWDDVIGKLSSRLSKWKLKALSIGGRLTLIKSVLSSLPLYQMSSSKCPMGVISNLESIRHNFFNGVTNSDRKLALIGWQKAMYGKRGALDSLQAVSSRNSPWMDIIREFRRLSLKEVPLKLTYPRLFSLELDKNISIADKMRDTSLISSFRRVPRGGIEEDQVTRLRNSLTNVILSQSLDRWVWNLESSGDFSVKSARSFIDDTLLPKTDVPTRWVKVVPIKINIFAWKVSLDKLPTRLNLSLRGVDIPSIICPLCSISVESTSHLLFSCHLSRSLMHKVARWWDLDVQDFYSYGDWLVWLSNIRLPSKLKGILEGVKRDSDVFTLYELYGMIKELGLADYNQISFTHFRIPGISLDDGLVPQMADADVINY
ncbi:RNA-directed DNA polymerase, eukaryota, reverse transcriptase zinc-binding domain protein [Tanacetum coccineum]